MTSIFDRYTEEEFDKAMDSEACQDAFYLGQSHYFSYQLNEPRMLKYKCPYEKDSIEEYAYQSGWHCARGL